MSNDDDHRVILDRIGKVEMEAGINGVKLDNIQTTIDKLSNGVGARVEQHGETIASLKTTAENTYKYIEAVNKKTDTHIEGHWKWMVIVIGLLTIGSLVMKYIR